MCKSIAFLFMCRLVKKKKKTKNKRQRLMKKFAFTSISSKNRIVLHIKEKCENS